MDEQKQNEIRIALTDVFSNFAREYTNSWINNKEGRAEKIRHWTNFLIEQGVTGDQIRDAYLLSIKRGQYDSFMPNLREFCTLCFESSYPGVLPTPEEAYLMASSSKTQLDRHPLVIHVANLIGSFELRSQSMQGLRSNFIKTYEKCRRELLTGELVLERSKVEKEEETISNISLDESLNIYDKIINNLTGVNDVV